MLFRGDQGGGLQDFHNYGFSTFRHCWKMSAVQPNKWPNKQCGPGQDFTGVTFVFGFQSRSASHISPPQSLQRSAAGVSQTARFQRANSQTTEQETTVGVSLKKTTLQHNFRLVFTFLCCHTTVLRTLGRGAAGWMMARGFPRSSVTLSLEWQVVFRPNWPC